MMVMIAWLVAALVFATYFMKIIVPRRALAIASNVAFIGYGCCGSNRARRAEENRSFGVRGRSAVFTCATHF